MIKVLLVAIGLTTVEFCYASKINKDTLEITLTPRIHSAGHFPFSGAYVNRNLSADINLFATKDRYGAFVFKSFDIQDIHSIVNYLQVGMFRKFWMGQSLEFDVFGGYLYNQTASFNDKDSDWWFATVIRWRLSRQVNIENTSLLLNPVKTEYGGTLTNRTVVNVLIKKFTLTTFVWARQPLFAAPLTLSGSFAIQFPQIGLSERINFSSSIAMQSYLTNAKPDYAMRNGFLFSLVFPVGLSKKEQE